MTGLTLMMRGASVAIALATLLGLPDAAAAADTNGFRDFRKAVSTLNDAMTSYCRGPGAGALSLGPAPMHDQEAFLRACGRSLDGKAIPGATGLDVLPA